MHYAAIEPAVDDDSSALDDFQALLQDDSVHNWIYAQDKNFEFDSSNCNRHNPHWFEPQVYRVRLEHLISSIRTCCP